MFWLAPNTCFVFSVQCDFNHFVVYRELFGRVLYTDPCWHIDVIRCSFSSWGETITYGNVVHLFSLEIFTVKSLVCWIIEQPPLSYPKGICVVWESVTLAKKSLLPLLTFLCPAICTVLPLAVRTLRNKIKKVHFQKRKSLVFIHLTHHMRSGFQG